MIAARLPRHRAATLAAAGASAAMGWGVFTFGAVYPWAYWPLAAAVLLTGLLGWYAGGASVRAELLVPALGMACFLVLALMQVVPFPMALIERVSPATVSLLREYEPAVGAGLVQKHSLSVSAALTVTALLLFACWSMAAVGLAALFSRTGVARTAQHLTIIGSLVALVGIIQAPFYNGRIYGFWQPFEAGSAFGPFVNRNHFAGWMLMAVPVAAGLVIGNLARESARMRKGVRVRLLWLTSPDANRLLLLAGCAAVMALSLVLTMSRSGLAALVITAGLLSVAATRRQRTWPRRLAALLLPAAILAGLVWWAGFSRIESRLHETGSRIGAWSDAWSVVRAFPLTGTGLNTYGVVSGFYQRHDLAHQYDQAHNDYLQLAAEGGVLLTVPAALAVLLVVGLARRRFSEPATPRTYWVRFGAAGGLLAIAIQECFDFSLQMPGNAVLCAILCGIVLHRAPVDPAQAGQGRGAGSGHSEGASDSRLEHRNGPRLLDRLMPRT